MDHQCLIYPIFLRWFILYTLYSVFYILYLILYTLYSIQPLSSHSGRAGRRTAQAAASRIRSVVYNAAQISNVGPFVRLLRDKCRYDTLYFSVYILYTYTFVWLLRDKCREAVERDYSRCGGEKTWPEIIWRHRKLVVKPMIDLDCSFCKWTVLTISVSFYLQNLSDITFSNVHFLIPMMRNDLCNQYESNIGCWSSLWLVTIPRESLGLFDTTHGTNCNQWDPRMSSAGTLRMHLMTPQSRWGLWGHQGKRKVAVLFAVTTNSTSAFVCDASVGCWF